MSFLTGVIEQVRERFPKAELTLRADAGFALPGVFEYLDDHKVRYGIGMGSNSTLEKFAEPGMKIARALSEASEVSERVHLDKQYETRRSWPHSRRVIIKAEVTRYPGRAPRDNPRFVITDLTGDAAGRLLIKPFQWARPMPASSRARQILGNARQRKAERQCSSGVMNHEEHRHQHDSRSQTSY